MDGAMQGRREVMFGLLTMKAGAITVGILSVVVMIVLMVAGFPSKPAAKDVMLVYVGAENCAPCDTWQQGPGDAFRRSADFGRLIYREVKSPSLFDVLKDENWPEDLRSYRRTIHPGAGVPLWLVIADGRLVTQSFGATQWKAAVLPTIKSLLR